MAIQFVPVHSQSECESFSKLTTIESHSCHPLLLTSSMYCDAVHSYPISFSSLLCCFFWTVFRPILVLCTLHYWYSMSVHIHVPIFLTIFYVLTNVLSIFFSQYDYYFELFISNKSNHSIFYSLSWIFQWLGAWWHPTLPVNFFESRCTILATYVQFLQEGHSLLAAVFSVCIKDTVYQRYTLDTLPVFTHAPLFMHGPVFTHPMIPFFTHVPISIVKGIPICLCLLWLVYFLFQSCTVYLVVIYSTNVLLVFYHHRHPQHRLSLSPSLSLTLSSSSLSSLSSS